VPDAARRSLRPEPAKESVNSVSRF